MSCGSLQWTLGNSSTWTVSQLIIKSLKLHFCILDLASHHLCIFRISFCLHVHFVSRYRYLPGFCPSPRFPCYHLCRDEELLLFYKKDLLSSLYVYPQFPLLHEEKELLEHQYQNKSDKSQTKLRIQKVPVTTKYI